LKKDVHSIDKSGFSNKFFEELEKEYEKVDSLANKQKELKQKHTQSTLQ